MAKSTLGDSFFTDGAAYERLMGRWSRLAGQTFLDWIAVAPDLKWLDIGCGTGVFTLEVSKHCSPAQVFALDSSADQLGFARHRRELQKTKFCIGDAQNLPFASDCFDVTVMALVIHFVPQPLHAVTEMARVLRAGGLAASYVWDYSIGGSPTAPFHAATNSIGLESPTPPRAKDTTQSALRDLWSSAGFRKIEVRQIALTAEFIDFDEFWRSMSVSVGPVGKAIAQMSAGEIENLRSALREQVAIEGDGRVAYQCFANGIKGVKGL